MLGLRHIACACVAVSLLTGLARASPDPEHHILASGELTLGSIYRDRFRRLLSTTGVEDVAVLDATLKGTQFQGKLDLDLKAENQLTDDALVDFTNRVHAEYDSPDDIQAGRYRLIDNRFQALWGLALDPETTMKVDTLVRNHYDVLFPETSATSADLSLALDTQLHHDTWLTFAFTGDYTAFQKSESPDYLEGVGRIALQWHDPRRVRYVTLPTPVDYPQPPPAAGPPDAFRYGPELGLHDSKKLFPLGKESMIGHASPAPLVVSPEDRLFREIQDAGSDFGELELIVRGRDYRAGPFSDWRRLEFNGSYELNPSRGFTLEFGNQLQAQQYRTSQPTLTQADRLDDRIRVQAVRTEATTRQTAYVAVGLHRFNDAPRFDATFYEGGVSSLWQFGRRYWLYADTFYTDLVPEKRQADYPERREFIMTLGLTVDFTPCSHLTLSSRVSKTTVPQFETFFDNSFLDDIYELRFHHQLYTRYAVETGYRTMRRKGDTVLDDNRRENLIFLDSVLEF